MTVEALNDFLERSRDWKRQIATDEWFFAHLRDNLLARLTPSEAFEAIDEFVDPVLSTSDPLLRLEFIVVLESLARHTDTTQVPPKLNRCWDQLMRHIDSVGEYGARQLMGLRAWYRRPGL